MANLALHRFSRLGLVDDVKQILSLNESKSTVNAVDIENNTALMHALVKGNSSVIILLLESGADVNMKNNYGLSPFIWVILNGRFDMVLLMLENGGVNLNSSMHKGNTILHWIMKNGCENLISSPISFLERNDLYGKQVDVDAPNDDGNTPLHIAISYSNLNLGMKLVERCPNIAIRNKGNKMAFQCFFNERDRTCFFLESNFPVNSLTAFQYQLWLYIIQISDIPTIHLKVQEYLLAYPQLLFDDDAPIRQMLSVASHMSRKVINSVLLWFGKYRALSNQPDMTNNIYFIYRAEEELDETVIMADEAVNQDGIGDDKKAVTMPTDTRQVSLKLYKHESHFKRELHALVELNSHLVLKHLGHHTPLHSNSISSASNSKQSNPNNMDIDVSKNSIRDSKHTVESMYCLVMPIYTSSLDISCIKEKWELADVRNIFHQMVQAIDHIHAKGIIHCNLNMKNIIRRNGKWKIANFEYSCVVQKDLLGEQVNVQYTHIPPEFIYEDVSSSSLICCRCEQYRQRGNRTLFPLLKAEYSFDIWALGMIYFRLLTNGVSLKSPLPDASSNSDETALADLLRWSHELESDKINLMSLITDRYARNLLSRILRRDPKDRLLIADIIAHPFLSGLTPARMVGEKPTYDVYITYKEKYHIEHAKVLQQKLTALGLNVWAFFVNCTAGLSYIKEWRDGLVNCSVVVMLLSRDTIDTFRILQKDSRFGIANFFYEIRMLMELRDLGLINKFLPLKYDTLYNDRSNTPDKPYGGLSPYCVDSVEKVIEERMHELALGRPRNRVTAVAEVLREVAHLPGIEAFNETQLVSDESALKVYEIVSQYSRIEKSNLRQSLTKGQPDLYGSKSSKASEGQVQRNNVITKKKCYGKVYVSYRSNDSRENDIGTRLSHSLTSAGVEVASSTYVGTRSSNSWNETDCFETMISCPIVLCIVSVIDLSDIAEDTNISKFLFELRLMLELEARGVVRYIYPVFLHNFGQMAEFSRGLAHTSVPDSSHIFKRTLEVCGLGMPSTPTMSASDLYHKITDYIGCMNKMDTDQLLVEVHDTIIRLVGQLESQNTKLRHDLVVTTSLTASIAAKDNKVQEFENSLIVIPDRVNEKDFYERTPLHWGCLYVNIRFVEMLLSFHPNTNVRDYEGNTPLHLCVLSSAIDLMVMLLAIPDIDVGIRDDCGRTPLQIAVKERVATEIIDVLLSCDESKRSIDNVDNNGDTALLTAIKASHLEVIKKLVFYGADLSQSVEAFEHSVHAAVTVGCSSDILLGLLCKDDGTFSDSSGYLWGWFLDAGKSSSVPPKLRFEVTQKFLDKFDTRAYELAFAKDNAGRQVFSITDDECRQLFKSYLYFCGRYELASGPPVHCSATSLVIFATDHMALQLDNQTSDKKSSDKLTQSLIVTKDVFMNTLKTIKASEFLNNNSLRQWLETEFKSLDKLNNGYISVTEYNKYMNNVVSSNRKVAIKFMKNYEQYLREKEMRILNDLDSKYVVRMMEGPSDDEIACALAEDRNKDKRGYKYAFVMPAADRNLDAIFRQERPDTLHIRSMMREIGEAIAHLHSRGIMHGDLKLLNILRVNNRMCLVDLDAAAVIGRDFAGAKYSSGVLPPEMFAQLQDDDVEQYKSYWAEECSRNTELWQKIRPVVTQKGVFTVRTFKSTERGAADANHLPYNLLPASESIDIWSYGILFFTLCTGNSLYKVNRDDDLCEPSAVLMAATTTDEQLRDLILRRVHDPIASDLLQNLLRKNPEDRPSSMEKVLEHSFFSMSVDGGLDTEMKEKLDAILAQQQEHTKLLERIDECTQKINQRTIKIERMTDKTFNQIRKTEEVLLRGIFEATEVKVPTCFIILNQKLKFDLNINTEDIMDTIEEYEQKSLSERWLEKLSNITDMINNIDINKTVDEAINKFVRGETLYFYLIDEYSMKPIAIDPYPIEIKTPAELVSKVLPLLKISLKAMKLINTTAQIVRCLGYPVPTIPESLLSQADNAIGNLDQRSTVAEFNYLQQNVDKALNSNNHKKFLNLGMNESGNISMDDVQNVRGAALRELERFLVQNDSDNTFCNLRRVVTAQGMCCWTLEENIKKIQSGADNESTSSDNVEDDNNNPNAHYLEIQFDDVEVSNDGEKVMRSEVTRKKSYLTGRAAKIEPEPLRQDFGEPDGKSAVNFADNALLEEIVRLAVRKELAHHMQGRISCLPKCSIS